MIFLILYTSTMQFQFQVHCVQDTGQQVFQNQNILSLLEEKKN